MRNVGNSAMHSKVNMDGNLFEGRVAWTASLDLCGGEGRLHAAGEDLLGDELDPRILESVWTQTTLQT